MTYLYQDIQDEFKNLPTFLKIPQTYQDKLIHFLVDLQDPKRAYICVDPADIKVALESGLDPFIFESLDELKNKASKCNMKYLFACKSAYSSLESFAQWNSEVTNCASEDCAITILFHSYPLPTDNENEWFIAFT